MISQRYQKFRENIADFLNEDFKKLKGEVKLVRSKNHRTNQ